MKAKNATEKDKENLLRGYMDYYGRNTPAQNTRLLDLGLLKVVFDGDYTITDSGLAAIQPLIDKAAADELAREAAADEKIIQKKARWSTLQAKFETAGVLIDSIDAHYTYIHTDDGTDTEVIFKIALCVRYSNHRRRYEPQVFRIAPNNEPLDVDALIREAQDARTVAEILNGMLEQPEPEPQSDIPAYVIQDLADIRASAITNMLDRRAVISLCGFDSEAWLTQHKDRYMDALNATGEWVSKREGEQS